MRWSGLDELSHHAYPGSAPRAPVFRPAPPLLFILSCFSAFSSSSASPSSRSFHSLSLLIVISIQRIPRYNLILGELRKYTRESDPDAALLDKGGKEGGMAPARGEGRDVCGER